MVRCLARDTTAGPILFCMQLQLPMILVDHLLQTSLFPLQHYVQRRGAILEALYWISEGFWFSPFKVVMTSLLHFEDKVHRKGLAQVEGLLLWMSRLLSQVLEHLGFPEEPRIERRIRCTQVLSTERSLTMPIFITLQQQDQEEAADDIAADPPRGDDPVLRLRWRWRGSQFQIHLLHLQPLLLLPLLTLLALPILHNSLQSMSMSVLGS